MRKLKFEIPASITPTSSGSTRTVLVPVFARDRAEATKVATDYLRQRGWSDSEFKLWGCEAHGPDVTCENCS